MSATAEWSRSRFWLCHFLHNRHRRPRIDFTHPPDGSPQPQIAAFFARARGVESARGAAIIRRAAAELIADPAYIQSLRLLMAEQRYHRQLFGRATQAMATSPLATSTKLIRPTTGLRFELSILFIDDLLLTHTLEVIAPSLTGPAKSVALQVLRDRRSHLAFHAERLTLEYAAFNVIRRNLRRTRLLGMFRLMLAMRLREDAALLSALGISPAVFARQCRGQFALWLERIVPYRREALVRMLLAQAERPYDQPEG